MESVLVNRNGDPITFEVDYDAIAEIKHLRESDPENFPKIGILVLTYNTSGQIQNTLSRIPKGIYDIVDEIFVFDNCSQDDTVDKTKEYIQKCEFRDKFKLFSNPRNLGYGGNQKAGYQYALQNEFDYTVMLHGDGQYSPEMLPKMIQPIFKEKAEVVFGSRMLNKKDALSGGMPLYKWLGNTVLTSFENIVLGTALSEFHSGYRMYSSNVLKKIPFQENTDDWHFDTQIIIQCRALNVNINEIPIQTYYGEEECNVNGISYAISVCLAVLQYRLHQLHIIRNSRFFIERDVVFRKKLSRFSAHEMILKRVKTPGNLLDVNSSHGLLRASLEEKSQKYDSVIEKNEKSALENSLQADFLSRDSLTEVLRLTERKYDYIVMAETIEKFRYPKDVINWTSQFIKEDGEFVLVISNIALWFYRISLLIGRFNYGEKGPLSHNHVHLYTKDTALQLIRRSGLEVLDVKYSNFPFEVLFESTGSSKVIKCLDWLYSGFVKVWPKAFAYQFIISARTAQFNSKIDVKDV
ncbi:glycosyltransferase [Halobacteriovorax sp. GB3]|uniref:glycosyltransferase n=1 Tax=Halobacteriovorax sp. GB3 TaxID=2719615 RepID=UPI00235E7B73|nr:glycosyltransferase [Halobacteriovorax sp. GB3]MDD0852532.1 glycosyltransferase [Halobacteriovorax sp. GB3]